MLFKLRWNIISTIIVTLILIMGVVGAKPSGEPVYQEMFVLDANNISDYQWSEDGGKLAFTTCPTGQNWNCDLWVTDFKFETTTLIQSGVHGTQLYDWYGDWILLGLYPINPPQLTDAGLAVTNEIWKIRSDGSELTRLTSTYTNGIRTIFWNEFWGDAGTVSWAKYVHSSDLIYFSAHDGNGWWGPHLTTTDGTDAWNRVLPYSYSFTIGMSPSGEKLVWGSASYYNQPTVLYASNGDGSEGHLVKSFPVITSPLLLTDDYTIILSWPNGEIHAINIDGTNERTIIADEFNNRWTTYHPFEGTTFLMISNRATDNNDHIFKIWQVGDQDFMQVLTEGPFRDIDATYSPDGKYLLYRRLPQDFVPTGDQPTQLVVKDLVPTEIDNLDQMVKQMFDDGTLNKGQMQSLQSKLANALHQYKWGNLKPVVNVLHAFINHAESFEEEGVISISDYQLLRNQAELILEMIN